MQAIIHKIEPFDAAAGTMVRFTWKGNQIFQVRCVVKENETGVTVYDQTVDSMKPTFAIPVSSGLANGGYYVAYITVFDRDGVQSQIQNIGTPFYCFTAPQFSLSISEGDIIRTSSFLTALSYSQTELEPLQSFLVTLYSHRKELLQTSGTVYSTDSPSYLISGLEDGTPYYIQATGQTLHGMHLDTGLIAFSAAYQQKQIFSTIEANNMPELGCIELRSNIISTEGVALCDVVYLDGSRADLRDNSVTFDIGYEVKGDNSHVFAFDRPVLNQKIISVRGDSGAVCIDGFYREGVFVDSDGKKAVIEITASCHGVSYVRYSNYIPIPGEQEQIVFCLNRIGHFFDPKAMIVPK